MTPWRVPAARLRQPLTARDSPVRSVLLVALTFLVLLALNGVLFLRYQHSGEGAEVFTDPSRALPSFGLSGSRKGGVRGGGTSGAAIVSDVSIGAGGVLTASQRVAFDHPVRTVVLTLTPQSTTVGGGMFDPRIVNLRILTNHHPPISVSQAVGPGASVSVNLPAGTRQLSIVYQAHGSVRRSAPSSSHRAAALVTPLSIRSAAGARTTLHVRGTNVTNVGCIRPDGSALTCGSQTADGWTVTRAPDEQHVAVIAQLNLRR